MYASQFCILEHRHLWTRTVKRSKLENFMMETCSWELQVTTYPKQSMKISSLSSSKFNLMWKNLKLEHNNEKQQLKRLSLSTRQTNKSLALMQQGDGEHGLVRYQLQPVAWTATWKLLDIRRRASVCHQQLGLGQKMDLELQQGEARSLAEYSRL